MAKKKAKEPNAKPAKPGKAPTPTEVAVSYDLRDLPSAQHKAGLAGLLLQIESMRDRRDAGQLPAECEIPEVLDQTATTVVVRFTERSTQDLFDDLYDAEVVEVFSKSKWSGKPAKREETNPTPGPTEPRRLFVYDTVQPSGHFLRKFTEGDKEHWHKLWRDMIYAVPRNRDKSRQPFKDRSSEKSTNEGVKSWKALLDGQEAQTEGKPKTSALTGSLMLAVQEVTAEAISFEDRAETQILLHFWPLTIRVFVPQRIDGDGKSEFVGYSLAIPEVAHIDDFCKSYKRLMSRLDAGRTLFRPSGAVVALPEQGPLEFLHNLDRLANESALARRTAAYVAGIEFFHMVVAGNNVKLMAHGRIPAEERLIEAYGGIRGNFHNPPLVAGLLLALLRGRPWFVELDSLLHEAEWSHLVHCSQERRRTPPSMIGFAWEVDRKFEGLSQHLADTDDPEETSMSDFQTPAEAVDVIIYDLVKAYVRERACVRAGVDPEDKDWWSKAADERRDVCAKLFLEFRSRHGDEFVAYFADTIASVAQWLPEGRFLEVSRALMRHHSAQDGADRPRTRDDVKTLTMLALAAHSRSVKAREAAGAAAAADSTDKLEASR